MTVNHSLDDREIIRRVVSGDINAYAQIVRAYQTKVLGLCASLLSHSIEAEDAAQDIFFKVYRSLKAFRGNSAFSTWLYRITVNHCKDLMRKKGRQKTESLDQLIDQMGDSVEWLLEEPSSAGVSAERSERIDQILSKLSMDDRIILTLREVDDLSYEEISKVLNCSIESVRARLRRAREALNEKKQTLLKGSERLNSKGDR